MARALLPFAFGVLLILGCTGTAPHSGIEVPQDATTPEYGQPPPSAANLSIPPLQGENALFWYFAYGSNLDTSGMRSRVGSWPEARPAILHGYARTFSGAADIRPNVTSNVPGAIYLLNESQMQKLDRYEGAPRVYRRINVSVESGNRTLPAVAYQYSAPRPFRSPSQAYFDTIKNGLLAYGYGDIEIQSLYREANHSSGN
ncbi:MAG: gamma-glutamylcyclotransferase family protein [Candidatus Micrarchaeia archaeon]